MKQSLRVQPYVYPSLPPLSERVVNLRRLEPCREPNCQMLAPTPCCPLDPRVGHHTPRHNDQSAPLTKDGHLKHDECGCKAMWIRTSIWVFGLPKYNRRGFDIDLGSVISYAYNNYAPLLTCALIQCTLCSLHSTLIFSIRKHRKCSFRI